MSAASREAAGGVAVPACDDRAFSGSAAGPASPAAPDRRRARRTYSGSLRAAARAVELARDPARFRSRTLRAPPGSSTVEAVLLIDDMWTSGASAESAAAALLAAGAGNGCVDRRRAASQPRLARERPAAQEACAATASILTVACSAQAGSARSRRAGGSLTTEARRRPVGDGGLAYRLIRRSGLDRGLQRRAAGLDAHVELLGLVLLDRLDQCGRLRHGTFLVLTVTDLTLLLSVITSLPRAILTDLTLAPAG